MDIWIEGSPHQNPRMLIQNPMVGSPPLLCRKRPPRLEVKHWGGPPEIRYLTGLSAPQTHLSDGKQCENILLIDADGKVIQTLTANIPGIASMHLMDIDQDGDLDLFLGAFQPDGPYNGPSTSQWWRQDKGQWHRDETFDPLGQSLDDVSDAAHFPAGKTTPPTLGGFRNGAPSGPLFGPLKVVTRRRRPGGGLDQCGSWSLWRWEILIGMVLWIL